MLEKSEYGSHKSFYGNAEPYNIGYFIDKAWTHCWPKVIGRAWLYQIKNSDNAKIVESGKIIELPNSDDRWYMDLLSHDPVRTKKALEAEGIAFLAADQANEEHWENWIFTKIIVKTREQSVNIKVGYNPINIDRNHDKKLDKKSYIREENFDLIRAPGHFLVLTLPPVPTETKYMAKALADYMSTNKIYPMA